MFRESPWLAMLLLSVACGDDGGSVEPVEDAGGVTAEDSGPAPGPVPGKAANVGNACGTNAACKGEAPECLTDLAFPGGYFSLSFHGGYCSAQCVDDSECSGASSEPGASCPLAVIASLPSSPLTDSFKSYLEPLSICLKSCQSVDDCRGDAYDCMTVGELVQRIVPENLRVVGDAAAQLFNSGTRYCFTTDIDVSALDGGAPDASLDAALTDGLDAAQDGAVDAGAPGVEDAGADLDGEPGESDRDSGV